MFKLLTPGQSKIKKYYDVKGEYMLGVGATMTYLRACKKKLNKKMTILFQFFI